jgi:repressor LexA
MTRDNDKELAILEYIQRRHAETGVYPSVREIATEMGFRSTNTVAYYLNKLERTGLLERPTRQARTFALRSAALRRRRRAPAPSAANGIPLLGRVAAGQPILAQQNFDGMVTLDGFFPAGEGTFALRVRGDSMIEAGIMDGDLVIVRQQTRVEQGEIGVAIIGDEATVKRIYDEGDAWRLQPENPALEPIRVPKSEGGFAVAGKVVGVMRRL